MKALAGIVLSLLICSAAVAQSEWFDKTETPAQVDAGEPSQADVRELLRLLGDQRINRWLQQRLHDSDVVENQVGPGLREIFNRRAQAVRLRVAEVGEAIAELPLTPFELADRWREGMTPEDSLRSLIYLIIFLFIGCGCEWLYWRYTTRRLRQHELDTASDLRASARRAMSVGMLRLGGASVFSIACIGAYLSFEWPEMAGQVVFSVLIIAVVLRMVLVLARVIFAPAATHLRMVPMNRPQARKAVRWIFTLCAVGLCSRVAADTFVQLDISSSAIIAVYFVASLLLALFAIAFVWSWRQPTAINDDDADAPFSIAETRSSSATAPLLWTVLVLIILVMDTLGTHQLKWLLLIVALLVPAIAVSRMLVNYFFDRAVDENRALLPVETNDPEAQVKAITSDVDDESSDLNLYRPVTQRLVRFFIIVAAVLFLFAVLDMPLWSFYNSESTGGKLVASAIDIAAVLLMADLIWVWVKTLIDRRLSSFEAPAHGQLPGPGARMATLLPLFRKVVFTVIAIMVTLVLLSSLGVNIGPLLAGAGVIGIAVGFGAQALVKDVVSGVFFLLEDAFRVGEYIEMGDLRGTVESISVRSFRVRHHLGAVHTIPYGELASLTNHSRDWAIVKMEFRVPFETDLKLVKKLVKKIGAELQKNEVYGQYLIEPLKSQGVRRMEEFNMVVGVKFMATPGQQWTIRRDAYQAIRDEFDKNGLSFAERSVKVEVVGEGVANRDAIAGAAQDAIESQLQNKPSVIDDTP